MQGVGLVVGVQGAVREDAIGARGDHWLLGALLVLFEALFHPQRVQFQTLLHLALLHPVQEGGMLKGPFFARRVIVGAEQLHFGVSSMRLGPRFLVHLLSQVSPRAQVDGRIDLQRRVP